MNLVDFATQQPSEEEMKKLTSTRVGVLIQQLIENAPQGGLDEKTEIEHLRSLQSLIDQRIQVLLAPKTAPSESKS
jgi:hypothetical protein